jgi:hypothetical protein
VIDLHLHTTASDGCCSPELLVQQAAAAGLTTLAVTDHDTVASTAAVAALCASRGIQAVSGIEITAVERRDVHVLGYFCDASSPSLLQFLARQREDRIVRVQAIAERLASLGMPIDVRSLLDAARRQDGHSIGRPQIARALIEAGHVVDADEAFDRWLGDGRPAYVARKGACPERVIEIIHAAGGLASLAHPGQTQIDDRIPAMRDAGLDALEVYHPDHPPEIARHYRRLADDLGLLVTAGSDYHGDPSHGLAPGSVTLPADDWRRIVDKIGRQG